jgi:GTP pyrophosphokinase
MTPDHRLDQRPKQPTDETAWHAKTARLDPEALLVRLADRIHNLRDLRNSPNSDRRERFLTTLTGFYLPLARTSRSLTTHLDAAYALLRAEHDRHRLPTHEARP